MNASPHEFSDCSLSSSVEETIEIARTFASSLAPNSVIALKGDVGAGKTAFVKGVALSLGITDIDVVCSPTFSYLNIYQASLSIFHFDLYRLTSHLKNPPCEFQEYFDIGGISCVEWPERAPSIFPLRTIFISLLHCEGNNRRIVFQ